MRKTAAKTNGDSLVAEISSAVPSRFIPKRLAIAVWVTRGGELEPVQAIGGWLTPTKP
jgi:hypothetical protein